MMKPVLDRLDKAGFEALELIGAVQFDSCIRYLGENPWDRLRLFAKCIQRTRRQAIIRSSCALGFGLEPTDICELFVEQLVKNGIERILAFDGLHDISNVESTLRRAKELGAVTGGWLIFCDSPVHTDAFYAAKAREFIERCAVDELLIEDTSGILTPERVRTLVPVLRAEIGDMRLGLHTHNLIGLGQRTYLEGAKHGIDQLFTCVPPIADGNAPPSVHTTVHNLRHAGLNTGLDMEVLDEVSNYFEALADYENKPRGRVQEFNLFNFAHQIPGGVLSNLASQLEAAGHGNRLDEVLEECGRIREELGWPIMVTPFSQFVSVQATFNVISGERYKSVPNEVKQYALGYFGELLAPVEPDILDRIIENGSQAICETPPEIPPALPGLRKHYPNADEEELLLRRFWPRNLAEAALKAVPDTTDYSILERPLHFILKEMADRPNLSHVFIEKGDFRIEMKR